MNRLFFTLIIIFLPLFSACNLIDNKIEKDSEQNEKQSSIVMPENMPADFVFSVKFGIYKRNAINTIDQTVTKDLIEDGTATTDINITEEEMKEIYELMKEVNVGEHKNLISKTNCMQEPYEEDEWIISFDGQTIKYSYSEAHCELTDDAKQLMNLRNRVFQMVKKKEAYKELPKSIGGYD